MTKAIGEIASKPDQVIASLHRRGESVDRMEEALERQSGVLSSMISTSRAAILVRTARSI